MSKTWTTTEGHGCTEDRSRDPSQETSLRVGTDSLRGTGGWRTQRGSQLGCDNEEALKETQGRRVLGKLIKIESARSQEQHYQYNSVETKLSSRAQTLGKSKEVLTMQ